MTNEFIEQAISRMEENTVKIQKCMADLNEDEIWKRPNRSSNSTANIILHLCGNITQYIMSSLGKTEDNRERDKEFSAQGGMNKQALTDKLEKTIQQAILVIRTIDADELLSKKSVQGFELSGIGIILHVVEHYSYHTGQIIFWTKLLKDKDMGFYATMDLNKKNKF